MGVEPIRPYLEPLRKSVTVPRTVEEAFEIFTARLGSWWPKETHSISQARTRDVVVEPKVGGALFEVRDDGKRCPWGKVLVWEPPHRFVWSWHPGREPETAQEVEVRFVDIGGTTRVELEHRNWAKLGESAAESRASYAGGWKSVFEERFVAACTGAAPGGKS